MARSRKNPIEEVDQLTAPEPPAEPTQAFEQPKLIIPEDTVWYGKEAELFALLQEMLNTVPPGEVARFPVRPNR